MVNDRVFSQAYLQQAGTPSPELIKRAMDAGDTKAASEWLDSLEQEIQGMYYNYRGWQKSILRAFEAKADASGDAEAPRTEQIIQAIEIPAAPERTEVNPERAADAMKQWQLAFPKIKASIASVNVSDGGDTQSILADVVDLHAQALTVHDGMMSRVNAMLSLYYREYGDQALQVLLQEVMDPSAMDPDGTLPFKEKVEKLVFLLGYIYCLLRLAKTMKK